jgi:hypothetical protein
MAEEVVDDFAGKVHGSISRARLMVIEDARRYQRALSEATIEIAMPIAQELAASKRLLREKGRTRCQMH